MEKINYPLADGNYAEIEVTEDFKREYEFMQVQDRARYWKIKKQKQRAGLAVKYDLSLDKLCENGYGPAVFEDDRHEELLEKDIQDTATEALLSLLTEKQREVYILHYIQGYSKVRIAAMLGVDEKAVRQRLKNAHKRFL